VNSPWWCFWVNDWLIDTFSTATPFAHIYAWD
jgi:hypothetical protein